MAPPPTSEPLTLVLTMGRVSSQSVHHAVAYAVGGQAFHVHSVNPHQLGRQIQQAGGLEKAPHSVRAGLAAVKAMMLHDRRVKVITLVREPLARNFSAAFASLRARHGDSVDAVADFIDTSGAVMRFWSEFHDQRPFVWFDYQLRETLDIDVFAHPFPAEGRLAFAAGRCDVLVMRAELADEEKSHALEDFFGVDQVPVPRVNTDNRGQDFAALYERFQAATGLTPAYRREIAESRYVRHFYA